MGISRGLLYSVSAHALVFAVGYYGMPQLRRQMPVVDVPIVVDVIQLDEKTNIPSGKQETKSETKPVTEDKPAPSPPPTPVKAEEPPPEATPEPIPEPEKKVVTQPKPKVKAKPKLKPKPKPPPGLAKVRPRHKPKPPNAFTSVLKTVEELTRKLTSNRDKPKKEKKKDDAFSQIASRLDGPVASSISSQNVTISEIDMLRRQIAKCWNIPAGAKDAQDINIEIEVKMNPDGTVRQARVVDQGRMRSDSFFRSSAEAALRAVYNPRCQPFKLSRDKYTQWKTMALNFNPKEMF